MSEISKMIEKVNETAIREDKDWMVITDRYGCPMRWLYKDSLPIGFECVYATDIHHKRKETTLTIEMNRMMEKFNKVV